jgi:hypothetical protein
MKLFLTISAGVLSAGLLAGCGSSNTSTPTSPSTPSGPITENFASVLAAGGATSRTFVATQAGAVTVGLSDANPDVKVGLGLGVPNGQGTICSLTYSVTTSKSTVAQISTTADQGSYCVEVFDVGNVPAKSAIAFQITVVHP